MDTLKFSINIINDTPKNIWFRIYSNDYDYWGYEIGPNSAYLFQNEAKQIYFKGFVWEKNDPEIWNPSFFYSLDPNLNHQTVRLTNVFGPRATQSIKVFLACLAGPADPQTRNDVLLIEKFKTIGVPPQNILALYEYQCSRLSIYYSLLNMVLNCNPGDILFLYLGGHGSVSNGEYVLGKIY